MAPDWNSLTQLIHIFHRMHHGSMRYEMEKRGLQDLSNPGILFFLHHRQQGDQPVSQKEIADHLGIAPPTVATSVKRMMKAGLVTKEPDRQDQRRNNIFLTRRGRDLIDQWAVVEQLVTDKIIEGFSPEEQAALRGYFTRMIVNLGKMGGRHPSHCSRYQQDTLEQGDISHAHHKETV